MFLLSSRPQQDRRLQKPTTSQFFEREETCLNFWAPTPDVIIFLKQFFTPGCLSMESSFQAALPSAILHWQLDWTVPHPVPGHMRHFTKQKVRYHIFLNMAFRLLQSQKMAFERWSICQKQHSVIGVKYKNCMQNTQSRTSHLPPWAWSWISVE